MADVTDFVVLPARDVEAALNDNGTDLIELLRSEGLEGLQQRSGQDPTRRETDREKEPVSIIVASAAAALAIAPLLSRVLSSLMHRTVLVKEMVPVPVEDSSGKVITDSSGKPVLQWVERSKLLESQQPQSPKTKVSIEGPLGLKISYSEE